MEVVSSACLVVPCQISTTMYVKERKWKRTENPFVVFVSILEKCCMMQLVVLYVCLLVLWHSFNYNLHEKKKISNLKKECLVCQMRKIQSKEFKLVVLYGYSIVSCEILVWQNGRKDTKISLEKECYHTLASK